MNFSLSNIAWSKEQDELLYQYMQQAGVTGLEIAPTRFYDNPYSHTAEVKELSRSLKEKYNLTICSMQSIWYGYSESIYNEYERKIIFDYSISAINFAAAANIKNIVFGCPKNRNIPEGMDKKFAAEIACEFLFKLAEYSYKNGTIFSLEPNPEIYGTNFINSTSEAFSFVKHVNSKGLKVNVDIGTMINMNESTDILAQNKDLINHVHLSVPYLEYVEYHPIHDELKDTLAKMDYRNYLSIEMKNLGDVNKVTSAIDYLVGFF